MRKYCYQGLYSESWWKKRWIRFWMRHADLTRFGRFATRCAALFAKPHKERLYLSRMNPKGYISADAEIFHTDLTLGKKVFVDDRVLIFQRRMGGPIVISDYVSIYRYNTLETGYGGCLEIQDNASIHPKCQLNAYVGKIIIGSGTMVAPCCAFYAYDHEFEEGIPIREQTLKSKGGITVGQEAWIGYGSIILDGVRIGAGAVVGAGSVVKNDVPDGTIVAGNPARMVKTRQELSQ